VIDWYFRCMSVSVSGDLLQKLSMSCRLSPNCFTWLWLARLCYRLDLYISVLICFGGMVGAPLGSILVAWWCPNFACAA
jgi:hypothetical protein